MSAVSSGGKPEPSHGRRIAVIWAVVTVIAVALVIFVAGPHIPPFNGSLQASDQHDVNVALLALATPIATLIWVYFGYSIAVFRQGAGPIADGPPLTGDSRIQVVWLAVTSVMVLGLAAFGTVGLLGSSHGAGGGQGPHPLSNPPASSDPLQVQVIGQQWLWTFRYPGYGGVETPTLVLPANRWVEFHVTSLDVIHSFWAYELGVKADAVPGSDNVAFVKTTKTESVQVRCAELCGLWHGHMNLTGQVMTPDQFSAWIAAQQVEVPGRHQGSPAVPSVLLPRSAEESRLMEAVTPPQAAPVPVWRRLLGFGIVWAIVLGIAGYALGHWIGTQIGIHVSAQTDTDQDDVAILAGLLFATLGWLLGLGFFNYPLRRMLGHAPSLSEHEQEGWTRYFRHCTDHKVVGIQYLVAVLFFFFVAGLNAMFIRSELTSSNATLINSGNYLTLVGLHGTMMLMMMSAGVLGPLGNYLVPLMIGARRMAFPRVESLTMWLTVLAGFVLLSAILLGGFPTGWTGYAPLADQARSGIDVYLISFALIGISLVLVGVNVITTVVTMRAPGMTWNRIPIFVWGLVSTSVLAVLAAPVLAAAIFMVVLDRTADTSFFLASAGGSPYLWDNLFWFFGHPEVYILALPGFGIVLEILPVFARKPLWGYRLAIAGMFGVALMSFMVWQHHLFVSGINSNLRPFYMFTTELISIPTGVIFLNGMGTLWRAKIRFSVPMLFALAFFFNFLIGGLSGVFLSDTPSDVTTHGSYFVMAHFHYTIMGGLVFALMAGLYYWLPKMTGLKLNEMLGRVHFWTMFIFFNLTFFPLFAAGLLGMPRRVNSYNPDLHTVNVFVSMAAFCLGASMLVLLGNLVWSLVIKRERAEANPWHAKSLEWQIPSPPPVNNFETIPVVTSLPYGYGDPDAPPVADLRPVVVPSESGAA